MKKSPLLFLLLGVLFLGLSLGVYLFWRASLVEETVLLALPRRPELTKVHPDLRQRLSEAETRARQGPGRSTALAELARLYHANGFQDEAATCYRGLLALEPSEPRWAHGLAVILSGYGQLDEALPLWKLVVHEAPDYLPARIRLGDALLKDNRLEEATVAYKEVLRSEPSNAYAEMGLGRIDMARERWQEARARIEAASSQTNYVIGGNLLVTIYEKLGLETQALALRALAKAGGTFYDVPDPWLNELWSECFDVFRLILLAGAVDRAGDTQGSVPIIERALALDPRDVNALYYFAGFQQKLGQPQKAAQLYRQCTELKPEFADPWVHLYLLQNQAGEGLAAAQTLQSALRACPKSPGLRLEYGRFLAAKGRTLEALEQLRLSSQLRPQEAGAYIEEAKLLFGLERIEEGTSCLHKAYEAQPQDPAVLSMLAFVHINLGHLEEAGKWLRLCALQPRVEGAVLADLRQKYRERFGRQP